MSNIQKLKNFGPHRRARSDYASLQPLEIPGGKNLELTYRITHFVEPKSSGQRLDHFLMGIYPRRSRAALQRAIAQRAVVLIRRQGEAPLILRASSLLCRNDEITVKSMRRPEPPVNFDYRIIFEDSCLLVINKPSPLPVHPAGRYFYHTLLTQLEMTLTHRRGHPGPHFYLPHRIDKETSGVLVLAKTKVACADLTEQFACRSPRKTYLAIVHGSPPSPFNVDLPLRRCPISPVELKMAPAPAGLGQTAHTSFRSIQSWANHTLVECMPLTGRQHQIRVHLEAAGYPIVGDKLYGIEPEKARRLFEEPGKEVLELPRHALHAHRLQLQHPHTRETLTFEADLPEDLVTYLETLPNRKDGMIAESVIRDTRDM